MVQILPETVKLKTANVNADQISVDLTWNKAKGCDSYDIYRRTYRSAWKMVARVKGNALKYTDPARAGDGQITIQYADMTAGQIQEVIVPTLFLQFLIHQSLLFQLSEQPM